MNNIAGKNFRTCIDLPQSIHVFITQRSHPCFSARVEKVDSDSQEIVWEASEQVEGHTILEHPKPGLYKYCLETVSDTAFVGFSLIVIGAEAFELAKKMADSDEKRRENDGESPTQYYQVCTYLSNLL